MSQPTRSKRLALVLVAAVLALSRSPRDATASEADWSGAPVLRTATARAGIQPCMIVGFNPQPEPPAWTGQTLFSIVDGEAQFTITQVSNPDEGLQNFQFLFGVAADDATFRSVGFPPDPIKDFRIAVSFDAGGVPVDFTFIVDVRSSSGGVMAPGSEVAFNPQPEPPAHGEHDDFETWGLDFGMTSLSDVTLTLRVEDAEGNPLDLVSASEPATLAVDQVKLFPNGAEMVQLDGTWRLDGASDGIDPAAEAVRLRLFRDGERIYPVGEDFNPVAMEASGDGWQITADARDATGIQSFRITATGDPGVFAFHFVDTRTGLPADDYAHVRVELSVGDDHGAAEVTLTENAGKWER